MTSNWKNNLHQFELVKVEWAIAEELRDILKILKDATLYFSHGTPNLPTVIPAMDHIDTAFINATLPSSKNHPAVHATIEIAKQTLNKYYSLTDTSWVLLHPRHKLAYFEAAGSCSIWSDGEVMGTKRIHGFQRRIQNQQEMGPGTISREI
ncbi:hypothetical protein L208DRAFT_1256762 [Tricholoma matsutake]|nr:hypothetical protein L208DRAFT_1256762 [Tricholoma matsutake 945]